ncbi:hypothetical protein CPB83DRAFT_187358 [Crepidotus variabilis]|uniref:Uncharacterized protein n=1 Tax=Crepidotus variabilis TaxID=179855 RepID=A0A9P6EJN9_9AGAR|nr:hypothetical protein CPB83DRAFT_187358 [Crepidotus variabilis]
MTPHFKPFNRDAKPVSRASKFCHRNYCSIWKVLFSAYYIVRVSSRFWLRCLIPRSYGYESHPTADYSLSRSSSPAFRSSSFYYFPFEEVCRIFMWRFLALNTVVIVIEVLLLMISENYHLQAVFYLGTAIILLATPGSAFPRPLPVAISTCYRAPFGECGTKSISPIHTPQIFQQPKSQSFVATSFQNPHFECHYDHLLGSFQGHLPPANTKA